MKTLIVLTFSILSTAALAGNGVKGGDPIRNRFLLAHETAIKITKSPACATQFTADECRLMELKLTETRKDECEGQKLCWYNTDSADPMPPLKPLLNGKPMDALLTTTPAVSSPITVDVNRAKAMNISQREATVVMMHEAGHAIGLSESLETDRRVIVLLGNQSFDDEDERPVVFRVEERDQSQSTEQSTKPSTPPTFSNPYQSKDFKLTIYSLDSPGRSNSKWNFLAAYMYSDFGTYIGFDREQTGRIVMGKSFSQLGYSVLTSSGTVIQTFAPVNPKTFDKLRVYLSSATAVCPVHLIFYRETVTLKEVVATCDPLL